MQASVQTLHDETINSQTRFHDIGPRFNQGDMAGKRTSNFIQTFLKAAVNNTDALCAFRKWLSGLLKECDDLGHLAHGGFSFSEESIGIQLHRPVAP